MDLGGADEFMGEMVELSMASSGAVTYSDLMDMPLGEIAIVADAVTKFLDR